MSQRATEPVQFRHDDPIRGPGLHARDGFHEHGSVLPSSGLVQLLKDTVEARVVKAGPSLDLLSLQRRRNEVCATSRADVRHADVSVDDHKL